MKNQHNVFTSKQILLQGSNGKIKLDVLSVLKQLGIDQARWPEEYKSYAFSTVSNSTSSQHERTQ